MNKETEKLYYIDTYKRTFTAKVLKCDKIGKKYSVVLDRTLFYPEGGGQPSDIGVLNTVNVLDVQEENGVITHTTDKPLTVGSNVTGGVNWARRFSLMQQHTGEHIVSGIIHRLFKFDNVGFHTGNSEITVDFNGELSKDDLKVVEMLANEAVYKNIKLKIWYPTAEQLKDLDYRSKKELYGKVRIVTIPGYDTCACCGTHINKTGEIGIIKILSSQRYKGGTRITMLCGYSAVADYYDKVEISSETSALLSVKPNKIVSSVEHLLEENRLLKQKISSIKNKILKSKAENIKDGTQNVCYFEEDLESNDLRIYCLMLSERCSGFAAVFSGNDEIGYKYVLASQNVDVREYSKNINEKFNGRGGGKQKLVQGFVKCKRNFLIDYMKDLKAL